MSTSKKRFGTKQIAITAMLLAICIVFQFMKNWSVFITGPIINACIVLAVLTVNLPCALILSAITPVTAFFIASSPVMQAVPAVIPLIALGNMVLAVAVQLLLKRELIKGAKSVLKPLLWLFAAVAALAKGAFMGATISYWLLPTYLPTGLTRVFPADDPRLSKIPGILKTAQTQFSLTQLITAAIGLVLVFILWPAIIRVVDERGE